MRYIILSIAVTLGFSLSAQDITTWIELPESKGSMVQGYDVANGITSIILTSTDTYGKTLLLSELGYLCGDDLEVVDDEAYVSIDGVRYTAPIQVLNKKFAFIVLENDPVLVNKLKRGSVASIVFYDGCRVENTGNFSLRGFTRAFDRL